MFSLDATLYSFVDLFYPSRIDLNLAEGEIFVCTCVSETESGGSEMASHRWITFSWPATSWKEYLYAFKPCRTKQKRVPLSGLRNEVYGNRGGLYEVGPLKK
jgi:hypothetical protein